MDGTRKSHPSMIILISLTEGAISQIPENHHQKIDQN